MRVAFAPNIARDFRTIMAWVGHDYPDRGTATINALRKRCAGLGRYPRRFPVLRDVEAVEVRKMSVRPWLVFYTLKIDHVLVLRIVHSATDWSSLFADEAQRESFQ